MVVIARICAPVLALLLLVLPVLAVDDTQEAADPDVAAVEVLDGADDDTSADAEVPAEPAGPTELDYLISINTYLTYLFCISAVFVFYFGGRLMYRFLNMFF